MSFQNRAVSGRVGCGIVTVEESLPRGIFSVGQVGADYRSPNSVSHFRLDSAHLNSDAETRESSFEGLVGRSPQMRSVFSTIRHVAATDVNVLICGESGTGKELVASAVHRRSLRDEGPFIALNMASIPAELTEATLFGHEKGAFTGADRSSSGAVAEANGGTLFLDEITEMPIGLQGKLLRFLQERVYRPVGGRHEVKSNVRIVSATNRDPLQAVAEKQLREDLYYRLNVVPIHLPPLRQREGDVGLLLNHFLGKFTAEYNKSFCGFDDVSLRILTGYHWPGNVRQLIHLLQRVVIVSNGMFVESHMLPAEIIRDAQPVKETSASHLLALPPMTFPAPESALFASLEDILPLEELERRAIERAIELCNGSAYFAAGRLGISPATIYRKLKLYNVAVG